MQRWLFEELKGIPANNYYEVADLIKKLLYVMKKLKHPIPEWVTRGKTIKQLIKELESFENQDLEVRLSLDDGDSHSCISLVAKGFDDKNNQYCVLSNSESYHENEWQDFMDEPDENI